MKETASGRPYRAAYIEPPAHAPNAALLIDFDNVTLGIRSDLQDQLRRLLNSEIIKGKVAVQRAYADWRRYPQYIVPLSEASIDLIFAPAFGSNKKNATDIRLAIDALELVFTRPEIGTFILLSGDSDFSSLVLKLKEYGKYVIGVGIRESTSDLLIQNCDEYYGYAEITGLMKEGELDTVRRDPWELVVEAVMQMKKEDDVMRSDRLKQVMQTIDPNFDEKDVGFSRFSKFVVEAAQRGLLNLRKMENGQYAVDLGDNANVPPEAEKELRSAAPAQEPAAKPRRKRTTRRRPGREGGGRNLTLAEAFELMRQALLVLGAVGDHATGANEVRKKMIELLGSDSDPVFERPRFQRLMRQAHDADLIELIKSDGDVYLLKLGPQAIAIEEEASVEAKPPEQARAAEPEAKPAPTKRRQRGSTRKASKGRSRTPRSRSTKAAGEAATQPPPEVKKQADQATAVAKAPEPKSETATRRHPRSRRGSQGGRQSARKAAGDAEPTGADTKSSSSSEARVTKGERGARTLGPRTGSRRRRSGAAATPREPTDKTTADEEVKSPSVKLAVEEPADRAKASPAADRPAEDEPNQGGSLLQRMSAAIQKVVKGPGATPNGPDG